MTTLARYEVLWNGLTALPGLSVFYSDAAADATAEIKAFFEAIKAWFPTPLTWQVPSGGDTIDDATGDLVGGWVGLGGGSVAATGTPPYAAGCGGYVNWGTNVVVNGRRLKGRTFLVPTTVSAYDTSGTMHSSFLAAVSTAAGTLRDADKLSIWHRPPEGSPSGGTSHPILTVNVPDQVTSLRSRRW